MTIDVGKNTLCYGDNLEVLRLHLPDECVDLRVHPHFLYIVQCVRTGVKRTLAT